MHLRLRIAAAFAAFAVAGAAQAAPLELDLAGLRAGGKLYVQVQTKAQYGGPERAAGRIVDSPAAGDQALVFDLPPGDYAISIWHDDNGNGAFDFDSATHQPLDGWATPRPVSGQPSFDQIKVTLTVTGTKVPLPLHYGR